MSSRLLLCLVMLAACGRRPPTAPVERCTEAVAHTPVLNAAGDTLRVVALSYRICVK